MRVAVISDIHGNLAALEAVLEDIAPHRPDVIVNLGDLLSGPFDPVATVTRLMELGLPTVRGNHDRWIVEGRADDWAIDRLVRERLSPTQLDYLRTIPATLVVGEVFLSHGTPASDETLWMDMIDKDGVLQHRSREFIEAQAVGIEQPVILCGHSHVPRTLRLAGGRLLVNPGSVGLPFALGSPDARYAMVEKRRSGWAADLRAVPYDPSSMQAMARSLGYPNWAETLATGWSIPRDL